jgi:hypothetical protein
MQKHKTDPAMAALKSAARRATSVYIHAHRKAGAPSWDDSAVFEVTLVQPGDAKVAVEVEGRISSGHDDRTEMREAPFGGGREPRYCGAYRPVRGFWHLMGATDQVRSAIALLPREAKPYLIVYLDAGTTPPMEGMGLHCDDIYLEGRVVRDGSEIRRYSILLDTMTTTHNTARFGNSPGERAA